LPPRRSAPAAATLIAGGIGRYPDDVETAVYYCCVEALQNVGKHAGANARAELRLSEQADELCFEIVDNGVGCRLEFARAIASASRT
jgi:signal transduction histidine kinase